MHVVAFHLTSGYREHLPAGLARAIDQGPESVSIFFVLSGFVLAYTYRDRAAADPADFWLSRFARIYPVYAFALVLGLPMFIGHPPQYDNIQLDITRVPLGAPLNSHVAALVAWILLAQAWIPSLVLKWNYPGWSLSVEAFFYALFPLLSVMVGARAPGKLGRVLWIAWGSSIALTACWWIASRFVPPNPVLQVWWGLAGKYHPLMRLPEFVIGIALGFWFMDGRRLSRPGIAAVLAWVAILLGWAVAWRGAMRYFEHPLLIPAYAVLVFSIAHGAGWVGRILASGPLVRLGEASYSLYLLHAPIIFAANALLPRRAPGTGYLTAGAELVAVALTSICASLLSYRFIENPARQWIRLWATRRRRKLALA
jgi:peptidoglycan/LPS O-acetylase OafA/YrhL